MRVPGLGLSWRVMETDMLTHESSGLIWEWGRCREEEVDRKTGGKVSWRRWPSTPRVRHRKDPWPQGDEEWLEAHLLPFSRFHERNKGPQACPWPGVLALELNFLELSCRSLPVPCSYAKGPSPGPPVWASKVWAQWCPEARELVPREERLKSTKLVTDLETYKV